MSDIPRFLHDGFESLLSEIADAARQAGTPGKPHYRAVSTEKEYFHEYARLLQNRGVRRVVFVSDSFSEAFPDERFLDALMHKVSTEAGFELYAFVGLLSDEASNPILGRMKEASTLNVGTVEVHELGMKPLLRGVFTNKGGICRAIQQPGPEIEGTYLFRGIDLTEEVLAATRSYLTSDADGGIEADR